MTRIIICDVCQATIKEEAARVEIKLEAGDTIYKGTFDLCPTCEKILKKKLFDLIRESSFEKIERR